MMPGGRVMLLSSEREAVWAKIGGQKSMYVRLLAYLSANQIICLH